MSKLSTLSVTRAPTSGTTATPFSLRFGVTTVTWLQKRFFGCILGLIWSLLPKNFFEQSEHVAGENFSASVSLSIEVWGTTATPSLRGLGCYGNAFLLEVWDVHCGLLGAFYLISQGHTDVCLTCSEDPWQ